ncbi:MAG: 3-phosphoshikimate 1-carboxyvinyltransferase, partial [Gemmatimonadales bacterium]|nr:3-phosphoshikimate 1-carboxyvinyltransferase [Gemmatimonadales bacterium]
MPGDKSLTQRALILASIASGTSSLRGLLFGGDAESTANALRAMGVNIPP